MTIRTTIVLLTCAAGIAAGVGGWLLGDQLFLQSASASLTPDEPALDERYPVSNTMTKQDRVIVSPAPATATPADAGHRTTCTRPRAPG